MAAMSRELESMAEALLPGAAEAGRDAGRSAKPSAPLRQRLQQSWQGKVHMLMNPQA